MQIRPAETDDCEAVFNWISDPEVQAARFSNEKISWQDHQKWFCKKLGDSKSLLLIGLVDNQRFGQVRFDIEKDRAEASIVLAKDFRGKGLGKELLCKSCHHIMQDKNIVEIVAHVRKDNEASIKLFLSAGFQKQGELSIKGVEAIEFVRKD